MNTSLPAVPAVDQQRPLIGIAYYATALLLFACLDTITKYLTAQYPVPLIAWIRYAGHFLLMTALLTPSLGRTLLVTQRTALVVVRSMCLVIVSLLMSFAFARLPLAEATSIIFVSPLLVVVLAGSLLKEHIGLTRWVAVLVGFCGVMLIARPSGSLDGLGVTLVLLAAVANTGYQLLSRLLSTTERALNLLYYSALLGAVSFGLLVPWFWDGPPPTLRYSLLFLALGVTAGLGHYLLTVAYREAPASLLAPVTYMQLVWAGLLGWLVFHQLPDPLTLAGMLIVGASGIAVAGFRRRAPRGPRSPR